MKKILSKIFYAPIAKLFVGLQKDREHNQPLLEVHEPLSPREEVVTVLFLDIIGFSAASLSRTPAEAFRDLKTMFDRITRIVEAHGGTVDRTLGDGLLAYFTANDVCEIFGTHADRALACGVAIHHAQIEVTLSAGKDFAGSVLPMRIGINTGRVYMGDLGNEDRHDFTIIGTAVNLGQRLEAACEINRIMVGEDTMAMAEIYSEATNGMRRRPIVAKSYQEPVNAFEFDPFLDDSESTRRFITAYRNFAQMDRSEERLYCESASLIMVTSHGHAQVINVSRSGVMLRFDKYIARGLVIYVSQVIAKVEHLDVSPMFLEVRWGNPETETNYLHGCLLKSFSEDQKSELWDLWRSVLARNTDG
jgi:class 3 adenylate cyclase